MDQKKESELPPLSETLIEPDPNDREATTLELDELWSFVSKKAHKRWIWIALSRRTRQVVAYVNGDRSQATCEKLWEAIPEAYQRAHCYSLFWKAYAAVIPAEHHTAVGIRSGQTAQVERLNCTLRQRLARLVRQTLSFSKSVVMHEACVRLFLHRYNSEIAVTLM
jgi:IS1 family transposase